MTEKGLLGLYVEGFEARYRRRWMITASGSVAIVRDLVAMAKRVGPEEAARAIRLVFSPSFRWVERHSEALANRNFYGKCIVPALDKEAPKVGEQAEWQGRRSEAKGYREVEL